MEPVVNDRGIVSVKLRRARQIYKAGIGLNDGRTAVDNDLDGIYKMEKSIHLVSERTVDLEILFGPHVAYFG
jgi:hypothetical protein